MFDRISELERIVEASEVSHHECAALVTLLEQLKYYVDFRANRGDLFAVNLRDQILKEVTHAA